MKLLIRIAIIGAIIFGGLYFIGLQFLSGMYVASVSEGYFTDVTYDFTIGEILDGICEDGEWTHEIVDEDLYTTTRVQYKGTLNGQQMDLIFVVFSGGVPRLDYFKLGDTVVNRSDSVFPSSFNPMDIDAIPHFLYEVYLKQRGD